MAHEGQQKLADAMQPPPSQQLQNSGKSGRAAHPKNMSLPLARRQLAQALGSNCRRLWRRCDLEPEDEVICDLVAEALARMRAHHS